MIRSLLGLLFILIAVALLMTAYNGDPSVIEIQSKRLFGPYAGAALLVAGFIVGKFWSLKWEPKRRISTATGEKLEEPAEEQMNLFEPRNKA